MKPFLHSKNSYEQGVIWMLVSASCLSVSFLFLKINLSHINYFFLLFLRFFIPLVIVFFAILFNYKKFSFHSKTPPLLQLSRVFCVLIAQYGFAFYLSQSTLLNATVLSNAAPLFIPLIEWVFLKQRPGKSTIVGAVISFFGVLLILNPDRSLLTSLSAIGILAAISQAGSQVLYGLKSKTENSLTSLFYLFFFTSVMSFFIYLGGGAPFIQQVVALNRVEWLYITLFLMALGTLFNQYYRGLAYRCGRPSTLATFLYFSVFVSALFDWLIFKQTPTLLTIIGSCLIIMGGVLKMVLRAHIVKNKKK